MKNVNEVAAMVLLLTFCAPLCVWAQRTGSSSVLKGIVVANELDAQSTAGVSVTADGANPTESSGT